MKTVLLHGLGQTAQDWKDVVCQLSTSNVECPELFSSMGNEISYSRILANAYEIPGQDLLKGEFVSKCLEYRVYQRGQHLECPY